MIYYGIIYRFHDRCASACFLVINWSRFNWSGMLTHSRLVKKVNLQYTCCLQITMYIYISSGKVLYFNSISYTAENKHSHSIVNRSLRSLDCSNWNLKWNFYFLPIFSLTVLHIIGTHCLLCRNCYRNDCKTGSHHLTKATSRRHTAWKTYWFTTADRPETWTTKIMALYLQNSVPVLFHALW